MWCSGTHEWVGKVHFYSISTDATVCACFWYNVIHIKDKVSIPLRWTLIILNPWSVPLNRPSLESNWTRQIYGTAGFNNKNNTMLALTYCVFIALDQAKTKHSHLVISSIKFFSTELPEKFHNIQLKHKIKNIVYCNKRYLIFCVHLFVPIWMKEIQ